MSATGSARDRFAAVATAPEGTLDLALAALLIAAEEYPGLDVEAARARLDRLAEGAGRHVAGAASIGERALRLGDFLFRVQGFTGNRERYDDPRNSFLNEVLERRTGIPISLSLVYTEVAARLGLPARGVGFPGHFLVAVAAERQLVIDAFFGRTLGESECAERLRAALGADARFDPRVHLRAAGPREILVRMLTNLKLVYLRAGDSARALACCERILLLAPDAPLELRDRGLLYERLECHGAALADLRRFLELAPLHASAAEVRARVQALEPRARRIH